LCSSRCHYSRRENTCESAAKGYTRGASHWSPSTTHLCRGMRGTIDFDWRPCRLPKSWTTNCQKLAYRQDGASPRAVKIGSAWSTLRGIPWPVSMCNKPGQRKARTLRGTPWLSADPANVEYRNTQLEALAPVLALETFAQFTEEHDMLCYIDNKAAIGAIGKGYSPFLCLCPIVAKFWLRCVGLDCHPWMEYVDSKSNPADPISRPHESGLSFARARNWVQVRGSQLRPMSFRFPPKQ